VIDRCERQGVRARSASACHLCAREGRTVWSGLRDRLFGAPSTWHLRRCSACNLFWLDPRPVTEDIPKLYAGYYTRAGAMPQDEAWSVRWVGKAVLY